MLDPVFPSQLKGPRDRTHLYLSFFRAPSLSFISSHSFHIFSSTFLFFFLHFFLMKVKSPTLWYRADPQTSAIEKVASCSQFPGKRYICHAAQALWAHRSWSDVGRSKEEAWARAGLGFGAERGRMRRKKWAETGPAWTLSRAQLCG